MENVNVPPDQTPEPIKPLDPTQTSVVTASANILTNKKHPFIFIGVTLLIVGLLFLVLRFFMVRNESSNSTGTESRSGVVKYVSPTTHNEYTGQEIPAATQAATVTVAGSEVDSLDLGDVDGDFEKVESEINNLAK